MEKPALYIDIDDTILAQCFGDEAGFDLRPGVVTQLRVLSRLFQCFWLTHWYERDIQQLFDSMYAGHLATRDIQYCHWRKIDHMDKAPAVLAGPPNFYWLEDPNSTGNLDALKAAGLMDRYFEVDPKGLWAFTRQARNVIRAAGFKAADIKRVMGKPEWFNEPLGFHFDWEWID